MIQGLAGVNGVSAKGKAQLCFNKNRVSNTLRKFTALQKNNPFIK